MKKITLFALIMAASMMSHFAQAQSDTYKLFKVDIGAGYGFGKARGVVLYLEPKFNVLDQVAVGLRMEAAVLGNVKVDNNNTNADIDLAAIGSYVLTGDYYLGTNSFRPFGGLGLGLFNMGSIKQTINNNTIVNPGEVNIGRKFGAVPRIGFEAGHFRMALEYNLITGQPSDFNRNYFTLKIGGVIGGGKK